MGALVRDIAQFSFGVGLPFSFAIWSFVTLLLLAVGAVFAAAAPQVLDPPAVLMATRPAYVTAWMPGSILLTALVVFFLAITVVGIPLTVLLVVAMPILMIGGYFAMALVVGDRLVQAVIHTSPEPWIALVLGVSIFRIVRLVPGIGAALHSLIVLFGYAAVVAVLAAAATAWHRRRMPDREQFEGETLVEWYPDGDPADGRPQPGTGRPVIGNLRGEEQRPTRRSSLDN